jgi:hypothetical protein
MRPAAFALVLFALVAFVIAPLRFGGNTVAVSPGTDLDAVLATLAVSTSVDKLLTEPAAFYDTAILYPDRTQLRSTEPFLGFALLALPLRFAGLSDTDTYEVLRWLLIALPLAYGYFLYRALGVGTAMATAGAVLIWAHGELLFGIERLQVLSIPLIVPAIYHALMASRSERPLGHAVGLFAFVALYPLCGAVNATIVALGALLALPWLLKAMFALRRQGRLAWCVVPVVLAVIVDVAALWPWLTDRADLRTYGLDEFLDVKHWNSVRVPATVDLVPVYIRSLVGPGMGAAILLLIAMSTGRFVRRSGTPPPQRHGTSLATATYLLPVLVTGAASVAASLFRAGEGTTWWVRLAFHAACWVSLAVFWMRQLRWSPARNGLQETAAMVSLGVGAFLCLMAFGPVWISNPHGLANHVLGALLQVVPPLKLIREYHRLWVFGGVALAIYLAVRLDIRLRERPLWAQAVAAALIVAAGLSPLYTRQLVASAPIEAPAHLVNLASHSRGSGGLFIHQEMYWNTRLGIFLIAAARAIGRPVVNGYLGIMPPYFPYATSVLHRFPEPEALWLLYRWKVDTVVALESAAPVAPSPMIEETFSDGTGSVWEIRAEAARIEHPSEAHDAAGQGLTLREVTWAAADSISPRAVLVEVPGGFRARRVQVQFRPSVVAQIPDAIDVFAVVDGAKGPRVNDGQSGQWIHSLAAAALIRRESPVAAIDILGAETTAAPHQSFLVEFRNSNSPPIERVMLVGQ